jgi:hypothetical protein
MSIFVEHPTTTPVPMLLPISKSGLKMNSAKLTYLLPYLLKESKTKTVLLNTCALLEPASLSTLVSAILQVRLNLESPKNNRKTRQSNHSRQTTNKPNRNRSIKKTQNSKPPRSRTTCRRLRRTSTSTPTPIPLKTPSTNTFINTVIVDLVIRLKQSPLSSASVTFLSQ